MPQPINQRPKIVSNIQIKPASTVSNPRTEQEYDSSEWERPKESWRRKRKKKSTAISQDEQNGHSEQLSIANERRNGNINRNKISRRMPRSAAISIKGVKEDFSYAEVLKTARQRISLKDIGIGSTKL